MTFRAFIIIALATVFGGGALAVAQQEKNTEAEEKAERAVPEAVSVEQNARVRIGGDTVNYDVVASETQLDGEDGEPAASIFSIAYTRRGVSDPTERPVLFVFNGGPGSASLWLHMGVFGPRRVDVPSGASDDGAPPYDIVDNPYSMLDVADLVFIDPVGTGWSRTLGDADPKDYYGLEKDADYLGRFIRLWLTENKRWNSPKYLAGESYGTTRAAALVRELQGGWTDVGLNGVILISAILDFQTARYEPGNDMPYIAYLPTMAAVAWYHDQVDKTEWDGLHDFVDAARTFAVEEYAPALLLGSELDPGRRERIIARLAEFTGLGETYLEQSNMRVNNMRFMKELLREEGLSTGRLDARYTGEDFEVTGETFDADPSAYGIDAAYTAAINDYFSRELEVPITRDYKVLDGEPGRHWTWGETQGGWPAYVNVAPWLSEGMRQNSELRVLLASGYYDLATPVFGAELSLQRNHVPQDRLFKTYYESGHMMYVHQPSLEKLTRDVRAFITGDAPGGEGEDEDDAG